MSTVSIKSGIWGAVPIAILQDKAITPTALRVYIALASFQGTKENAFPSLEAIAERAGVPYSSVSAATKCLATAGWIAKHRRGLKESNVYEVLIKGVIYENPGSHELRKSRKSSLPKSSETKTSIHNITIKHHLNMATPTEPTTEEATAAPSVPKDSSLFNAIRDSFLSVTPVFSNWGKEAKNIKTIEERVRKLDLDDPMHCAKMVLSTYLNLTRTGSEFWRGQPFTPSALASSGIWDRVLVELRRGEEEKAAVNDTSWVE